MEERAHCSLKYREGDFIETTEGLIFDVKGIVHPDDAVIAYVRYVPDQKGDRIRHGQRYRKIYKLTHRQHYLQQMYPHYLRFDPVFGLQISQVPHNAIQRHYLPQHKVCELIIGKSTDPCEKQTKEFITKIMQISKVPQALLGVSGSILVNLYSSKSDIDLIVYGKTTGYRVRAALHEHLGTDDEVTPYPHIIFRQRFLERQRNTGISFDKYLFHESRKTFQGYYKKKDFFIRYVKNWDEIDIKYGDKVYTNMGFLKLRGVISDDAEAIFTPCTYGLTDVKVLKGPQVEPIAEIKSFRGRFCDQTVKGERIEARGKLEKVDGRNTTYYRLLLGNTLQDYMVRLMA
jgi:predicted nucleotidyltransferase